MDDPELEEERHYHALRGLTRLNRVSAGAKHLWRPLSSLARQLGTKRLKLLDIATGGGDVPIALWQRAKRKRLDLEILGIDVSPRAVQFATERAERLRANVRFAVGDVLTEGIPKDYDVVVCSLFLHHLMDDQARRLLGAMASAARHMVIVSDLVRSRLNLALVRIGASLVTRSEVVHLDSAQSVRAAFRPDEMSVLANTAGMAGAEIRRCFPCRFLLTWRRSK
jgi:2-polyprenyl-3-methyl-5-hydroxy-6-metoxy-1,4-benzoquinol methylase